MDPEPIRFARGTGSKALSCIVYLIMGPALGIVLGVVMGFLLGTLATWLGASEDAAMVVGLASGTLALAGGVALAFRDFRRRAFAEVLIYPDRLEIGTSKAHTVVSFEEVRSMRLALSGSVPVAILTTASGETLSFPADIASFADVRPALEALLLPHLLGKVEETLASGGSIAVRESTFKAWGRIAYGLLLILLSPLLIATLRGASRGVEFFSFGRHLIRQGWRSRRGGFEMSEEGLTPAGILLARPIPWNEVSLLALDDDGIVMRSLEGQTASASLYAENFWALVRWIEGKVGGPGGSR